MDRRIKAHWGVEHPGAEYTYWKQYIFIYFISMSEYEVTANVGSLVCHCPRVKMNTT